MPKDPLKVKKLAKKVVDQDGSATLAILQDTTQIDETTQSIASGVKQLQEAILALKEAFPEYDDTQIRAELADISEELKKKDFFSQETIDEIVKDILTKIPPPQKGEKGDTGDTGQTGLSGLDGETPNDERIISLLEPLIPEPILPLSATEIRDNLETLDGDERFDAQSIRVDSKYIKEAGVIEPYISLDRSIGILDHRTSFLINKINNLPSSSSSGGGTPGGSDTQVQFNDSGAFGGDAGLTYNKTTDTLTAGFLTAGAISVGKVINSGIGFDVFVDGTTRTQGMRIEGNSASAIGYSSYVTGDSQVRFTSLAGGTLQWGSGTAVADTNLYRSAADTLKTDDALIVVGALTALNFNKVTITQPGTSAVLTILNSKTLTVNNTLTFAGTDATTQTFQASDTIVGRATTDPLTNKTITSATNILGGVTMTLGSDADGDTYYRTGSVLTRLAKGTAAQFLQMNAGATAPQWVNGSVAGTLNVNTTAVGNVGIGEDDLITYSVAGNTLTVNGDFLTFEAAGTIANSINAKRIKVYFGATAIFDTGAAGFPVSQAIQWRLEGTIIRTGAATQRCTVSMTTNNATLATYTTDVTSAETLSGASILKLTGEGTANSDVLQDFLITRLNAGNVDLSNTKIIALPFILDGGDVVLTTGVKGDLEIPFACTINAVTLLAKETGSIVVDIWKDTYANYPPTVADTITAAAKPTITAALKSQNTTLTGWTTSVAAGDILRFNIDSVTTITRCLISLKVTKT